jgi:pimeloyl-ACP methyl ester carboxylesterase
MEMGREIEAISRLETIHGRTASLDGPGGPTLVAVYELRQLEPALANYQVQLAPGDFEFTQPPGRYVIHAFEDLNGDFVFQRGEPYGSADIDLSQQRGARDQPPRIIVSMSRDAHPSGRIVLDLSGRRTDENLAAHRRNVGVIASLDDRRFSAQSGREVAMHPIGAFAAGGFGIFFEEAFDPARIPVLFVHGINGSPQDVRPLMEMVDREKFQVWFVFYPSTLRLPSISRILHEALADLEVTYGLQRLYVVAHSMGGLVSLGFIQAGSAETGSSLIRTFITLATPFSGQASAALIESTPQNLRPRWIDHVAWIDMVPGSEFIQGLYQRPLPDHVDHHLFLAYLPGRPDDGVVSIASQLDGRVEPSARIHAEPAGHVEILRSEQVAGRIDAILRDAYERDVDALRPGEYLGRTAVFLASSEHFSLDWSDLQGTSSRGSAEFEQILTDRAGPLDRLLLDPVVTTALRVANEEPSMNDVGLLLARDRRWRSGDEDAVVSEATDATCNRLLAAFKAEHDGIAEIIVTGRNGANVCQSNPTTDYYQADEAWWTRTANELRVWYDPLHYDESTDMFAVSLYIPLYGERDPKDLAFIGIAKVLIIGNQGSVDH